MVVWKYRLTWGYQEIEMPFDAVPLTARDQKGAGEMWVGVEPGAPKETRAFCTVGTGEPITEDRLKRYVGTCLFQEAALVAHVFEVARRGG